MPGTLTRSPVPLSQTRKTALAGLVGALALSSAPALAQQVYDLDEITVIANRVPTEIARSGASVSVISRAELDASGTVQLADYLNRLAGVSLTQDGGPGSNTNLRIRGADRRYIAVYIDGIRVDDPSSTSVQYDFGHLTTADVERIEVLRGSQSALYGGSAVGGVVNITSRRAEAEGFSQDASAEIGSFNTRAARYSLAFRDDRLEAALTIAHRRSDGFTAWEGVPETPGFDPNAEADGFEMTRLSFSARYQASEALAWGLSGFAQDGSNEYDGYGNGFADLESRQRTRGGRLFAEYDTGVVRHDLSISAYRIDREEFSGGSFNNGFEGRRTVLAYQGTAGLSDALTLVWGADTMLERTTAASLPMGTEATRTSGAFSQILWTPTATLDINATARIDRNSSFGTFPTGRLAMAWQAGEGLTLRGAMGRGFRAPSIEERFGDYGWFVGNPALEPETSVSTEIGLDRVFANGASLGATLFSLDTDNLITYDGSVFPNTLVNLPGISRRRGLELEVGAPLGERIRLTGSYTYTDARRPDGARIARVPHHQLSLGIDADLANRLRGSLSVLHVAGRPDDFGTPMPDFSVVNTNLRFALTDRADLTLRVDNLLDRQYQHTAGYSTAGRSFYLGVAARF